MKAKDLMKPRFVTIANYPDCEKRGIYVGKIISFDHYDSIWNQWYNMDGESKLYDAYYNRFPHIFKKLNWWEKRNVEDMPKRLICKAIPNDTEIIEIQGWDMNKMVGWVNIEKRQCCSLYSFNPAYGYFPVD